MTCKSDRTIILVNQVLGPFFTELAQVLGEAGANVIVLTGDDVRFAHPLIELRRGPAYRRTSLFTRFSSWSAFLAFTLLQLLRAPRSALVVASSNPPLAPHVAVFASMFKGFSVIARVLDIYPDVLAVDSRLRTLRPLFWVWSSFNRTAYKRCTIVITLGKTMARALARYVPGKGVITIPDWHTLDPRAVPSKACNPMRHELQLQGKLVVQYSGNIGRSHDLSMFVAAALALRSEARLHFLIISDPSQAKPLQDEVRAKGLTNWTFLPWQPPDRLPVSLGIADLAVVTQLPASGSAILPCKIYNYMAAGAAVLAVCPAESDVARIVQENSCGYRVDPGDLAGLVGAVSHALHSNSIKTLGENAQHAACKFYSPKANLAKLTSCLLN